MEKWNHSKGNQENWENLADKVKRSIIRRSREKIRWKKKPGRKPWWDKECRESKTKVNKTLIKLNRDKLEPEHQEEKRRHKM